MNPVTIRQKIEGQPAERIWAKLDQLLNHHNRPLLQRTAAVLRMPVSRLNLLVLGGTIAVFLLIGFIVLCLWLRGRFEFIFLDNLMQNRNAIRKPWREFKSLGNSYFVGTLIFLAVIMAGNLLFAAAGSGLALSWLSECAAVRHLVGFGLGRIYGAVLLGTGWAIFSFLLGLYFWFFFYLLVPVMYRERIGFREGLRKMNSLIFHHFGTCLLFWLMMLIVQFGFGLVLVVASIATCCIFGFLLGLPYVGSVLLLPYWTFLRLAGVEFLEQLDPRREPPVPPEPAEPEIEAQTC